MLSCEDNSNCLGRLYVVEEKRFNVVSHDAFSQGNSGEDTFFEAFEEAGVRVGGLAAYFELIVEVGEGELEGEF